MQKSEAKCGLIRRLSVFLVLFGLLVVLPAATARAAFAQPLSISVKTVNSWKEGSYTFSQVDVTVKNTWGKKVTNWKLKFTMSKNVELVNYWNGKFTGKNKTITVKPETYNKSLRSKETITIGYIIKSKGKPLTKTADVTVWNGAGKTTFVRTFGKKSTAPSPTPSPTPTPTPTPSPTPTPKPAQTSGQTSSGTPLAQNGRLKVKGTKIVNEKGTQVILKGVSTHGINWFPQYVNKQAFKTLRDQWGVNCIRLAMYTEEYNGYCSGGNKTELKNLVKNGVKYATDLGMYVIIDWHILSDGNPQKHQSEAASFFKEMSKKYKGQKNVIYEICNEPNGGTSWPTIKAYAEAVIKTIRANDQNAIILVGTPTWSQDVDVVADNPIKGYSNIMYAFHFYAATHKDWYRTKVSTAVRKGLPVFVSEFGISEASGNGYADTAEGNRWISFLKKNGISFVCWNLSNKAETSALISSSCTKTSGWSNTQLTAEGKWYKGIK